MNTKDRFAGGRKPTFAAPAILRKNQMEPEEILWNYMSKKPISFKFRRQPEIGMTGLTFLCFTNDQAKHNLDEVKQTFKNFILSSRPKIVKPDEPSSPL